MIAPDSLDLGARAPRDRRDPPCSLAGGHEWQSVAVRPLSDYCQACGAWRHWESGRAGAGVSYAAATPRPLPVVTWAVTRLWRTADLPGHRGVERVEVTHYHDGRPSGVSRMDRASIDDRDIWTATLAYQRRHGIETTGRD